MEKVIDVKVNVQQAKKNFNDVNDSIKLQEKFVADLKLKIAELEFEMSKMNGTQQMMASQTLKDFNAELKVEAAALRTLKVEAAQYNEVLKKQNKTTGVGKVKALEFNESLLKNRDIQSGLNTITGGLSGQIVKFSKLFVSASKGIKLAGLSLNLFKKALIATGIGAIVVLVGTLVANFDKLKDAINGVSSTQKDQLNTIKDQVAAEQSKLDTINNQDETLKRQGKSEEEILQLKMKQTEEVIESLKLQLEQEKQIKKSQVAAAERNQKIMAGIIGVLTAPVTMILAAIDAVTYAASFVPGLGVEATSLAKDFTMDTASMLFDPEKTAKEGDKVINETEKKLTTLVNTRDGYHNKLQDRERKHGENMFRTIMNSLEKTSELLQDLNRKREEKDADTHLKQLELERKRALEKAEKEIKNEKFLRIAKQKLNDFYDEQRQEAIEKDRSAVNKIFEKFEKEREDKEADTHLKKLELERERAFEELQLAGGTEQDKFNLFLHFQKLRKEAQDKDNAEATEKLKKKAADDLKIEQEQEAARLQLKMQSLDSAIAIANEETAVGKALLVAKQIMLAREAVLNFKKNLINATSAMTGVTITASEAATQTTASIAKAANVAPPPLNLPFIATALATAASVMSAVKAAVDATKGAASAAGAGGGITGAQLDTPRISAAAPSFNIVGASPENQLAQTIADQTQQPVQAYVVANDVTTAQGLERNIIQESSLG